MSILKSECCECYSPIDINTNTQNSIICPGCGLLYELVYFPKLQPKKCMTTGLKIHRGVR